MIDYSSVATFFVLMIPPTALGHQTIRCSDVELVQLNPPSGMSCAQYLNPFISTAGGYLINPDATTACSFCSMSTADQFLASGFNIFYDHAWRNFGLMFAYIVFNVCLFLVFFGLPRSRKHRLFSYMLRIICSGSAPGIYYLSSERSRIKYSFDFSYLEYGETNLI